MWADAPTDLHPAPSLDETFLLGRERQAWDRQQQLASHQDEAPEAPLLVDIRAL